MKDNQNPYTIVAGIILGTFASIAAVFFIVGLAYTAACVFRAILDVMSKL